MHLGGLPRRYDLALALTHLKRVVEYDSANLTLMAEAGLPLHQVYALTSPERQFLPLGCASSRQSLGGVLVTNTSGVKRLRYGAVRDLLLGVRVALPDGALVRFGGRVVKNVAGYDMNKLFLGSLGTFGVVVETTYRLTALPQDDRLLVVVFATLTQALHAVAAVRAAALWPSALTVLPAVTVQELPGIVPGTVRPPHTVLCLNYDGTYEGVAHQLQGSRVCCQPYGPVAEAVVTGASLLSWWEQVETWRTAAPSGDTALLCLRCGVPPAYLGEALVLLDTLPAWCAQPAHLVGGGRVWPDLGAHGVARLQCRDVGSRSASLVADLAGAVTALPGLCCCGKCPRQPASQLDLWGHPAGWQLLPRYKQQFDPLGRSQPRSLYCRPVDERVYAYNLCAHPVTTGVRRRRDRLHSMRLLFAKMSNLPSHP